MTTPFPDKITIREKYGPVFGAIGDGDGPTAEEAFEKGMSWGFDALHRPWEWI